MSAGGGATEPLLKVEDIHTYYGRSHIRHGVSLEVGRGEVVGLLGRNGVGKSTTLKVIAGLVRPSVGRILRGVVDQRVPGSNRVLRGEVVIYNVIGGIGTLVGPIVGAAFFLLLREGLSRFLTEYYLIPLGIVFIAVVIFMPQGRLGFARDWLNR